MEWRQPAFLQREIAGGELLQPVAVRATQHDYARAAIARAKLCRGPDKGWRESGRWKTAVVLCGGILIHAPRRWVPGRQTQIPSVRDEKLFAPQYVRGKNLELGLTPWTRLGLPDT